MVMFLSEMDELEYFGALTIVNPLKAKALDDELLRAARLQRRLARAKLSVHDAIERALLEQRMTERGSDAERGRTASPISRAVDVASGRGERG